MSNTRSKRSNEELVGISGEHLCYEIQMLLGAARALSMFPEIKDVRAGILRNALIESFSIHARNLLDFLYPKSQPKIDDVIAEDFFENPEAWLDRRLPKSGLLTTVHARVGKEVAHLTYVRLQVTAEDKQWHFIDIANGICEVLREFVSVVPASSVSESFHERVSHLLGMRR